MCHHIGIFRVFELVYAGVQGCDRRSPLVLHRWRVRVPGGRLGGKPTLAGWYDTDGQPRLLLRGNPGAADDIHLPCRRGGRGSGCGLAYGSGSVDEGVGDDLLEQRGGDRRERRAAKVRSIPELVHSGHGGYAAADERDQGVPGLSTGNPGCRSRHHDCILRNG